MGGSVGNFQKNKSSLLSTSGSNRYIKLRNNFLIDRKLETFTSKSTANKRGGYQSDASAHSAQTWERNKKRFSIRKVKRTRIYSDANEMTSLPSKARSNSNHSFKEQDLLDLQYDDQVQTFNINDAFKQIGGFGRFQVLALILLYFVRNYGMWQVFSFCLLIAPQEYECFFESNSDLGFSSCSIQEICEIRNTAAQLIEEGQFEYRIVDTSQNYMMNWFIHFDMMCLPESEKSFFCSSYFIGFCLGVMLSTLPDSIGRKATLNILMPLFLIASWFVIFGQSIFQKEMGLIFQGLFHVKIMLSYSYIFELTEEKYKAFCATFINIGDLLSFSFIGLYLVYVDRNIMRLMEQAYIVQSSAIIAALIILPESPQWLFLKGRHSNAISNLNYVAWFNGSTKFIPENAQFDFLDQALVTQQQTVKKANDGVVKLLETQSVFSMMNQFMNEEQQLNEGLKFNDGNSLMSQSLKTIKQKEKQGVLYLLKQLFCKQESSKTFYRSVIVFIVTFSMFYLSVFGIAYSDANHAVMFIIFGCSGAIGIFSSKILITYIKDYQAYIIGLVGVLVTNVLNIRMDNPSSRFIYTAIFVQSVSFGILMNSQYLILSGRIQPHLISLSLELCFCISQLIAGFTPVLATFSKPIPNLSFIALSILGIVVVSSFKESNDTSEQLNDFDDDISEIMSSVISSVGEDHDYGNQIQEVAQKNKKIFNNIMSKRWMSADGTNSDALSSQWNKESD